MGQTLINDIKIINLPLFEHNTKGMLIPTDFDYLPIEIKRIFQIIAPSGAIRGEHSHKIHSQIMFCTIGKIKIECDDGNEKKIFNLTDPNKGILIPPNIWSKQTYIENKSILTVLCDAKYDEKEYIRDYDNFLKSKNL